MKRLKQWGMLLLAVCLLLQMGAPVLACEEGTEVTVLFTHDLHSHLLPADDENGVSYGGYARLKTAIDRELAQDPDALLLDGGDFSVGSLFQTSFTTSAVELRVMAALGVEVTTFGNHEYDNGPQGLADMLNAALDSGDPLPAIVETNYLPQGDGSQGLAAAREAFTRYGVEDYVLLEKGGVWFAVFSSYGLDAEDCAPTSEMTLVDRVTSAQATVDAAKAECLTSHGAEPLVVCLSHAGTENGKGEDYDLAKQVEGIDLIISAHTHTVLEEPIQVDNTYIVSAGAYGAYLGVVTLRYQQGAGAVLSDYRLVPIDDSLPEDEALSAQVEEYKHEVERDYLSRFDMTFDQVLVENPYQFDSVDEVYARQKDSTLGDLFADAYKWAVEEVTGEPVDLALTATGVIRESLAQGQVKVCDVFTAASLGAGASDVPGGALVAVWLTGEDLKNVLEVDASVQPLMSAAQLFCSGVRYSFNTCRMIFNKVDSAVLCRADGSTEEIQDDALYRVVTGTYAANMLGSVKEKSYGLLSVTPRDANGDPIDMDHIQDYIVCCADGSELKEWYAIARYLQSMGGEMDEAYAQPDGRKQVYSSLNPVKLLRHANTYTYVALAVILLLAWLVFVVARAIRRRKKG